MGCRVCQLILQKYSILNRSLAEPPNTAAPYPVRLARPWPYLDFEKEKAAAAAAVRRHYRGLTWLGRARRAGGAPG